MRRDTSLHEGTCEGTSCGGEGTSKPSKCYFYSLLVAFNLFVHTDAGSGGAAGAAAGLAEHWACGVAADGVA
eukprot:2235430-Prymnesium_polylepis.1